MVILTSQTIGTVSPFTLWQCWQYSLKQSIGTVHWNSPLKQFIETAYQNDSSKLPIKPIHQNDPIKWSIEMITWIFVDWCSTCNISEFGRNFDSLHQLTMDVKHAKDHATSAYPDKSSAKAMKTKCGSKGQTSTNHVNSCKISNLKPGMTCKWIVRFKCVTAQFSLPFTAMLFNPLQVRFLPHIFSMLSSHHHSSENIE